MESLLAAIDAARSPQRGFTYLGGDQPYFHSFAQLREATLRAGSSLRSLRIPEGERVAVIATDERDFVEMFLCVVAAGLVPVPLSPPVNLADLGGYLAGLRRTLAVSEARLLVAGDLLADLLAQADLSMPHLSPQQVRQLPPQPGLASRSPDDLALIQFTSGSTAVPKGVMITHRNLMANVSVISDEGLHLDGEADRLVSWLPTFHDMGLIGFLVVPLIGQIATWLIPPLAFARTPSIWCDVITQVGGTVSFAPNFAYERVARRTTPEDVARWDLASWRVAGCGAEPILPDTVRRFTTCLGPARFREEAFLPAYGMAEATLAISFGGLDAPALMRTFERPGRGGGSSPVELVSVGKPFSGHTIRICGRAGRPVPPGVEGEIQIRGPSVSPGYLNNSGETSATFVDGWLHTGDLGLVHDGNLYVTGRVKDVIIIDGRNYYPHDIEACVSTLAAVRAGRVVAFGEHREDREHVVVAVELNQEVDDYTSVAKDVRSRVRRRIGVPVGAVLVVDHGAIKKTSSGKPRRSQLKADYLAGSLADQLVAAT